MTKENEVFEKGKGVGYKEGYQDAVCDVEADLATVWKKHLAKWKKGETTEAKPLVEEIFDDVFKVVNNLI